MTDEEIISLYWARDERAIQETETVYGRRLDGLAMRYLANREDAEETVNDTYLKTWETVPPKRPNYFYAYLAKICRFLSMDRLDWRNAAKRSADVVSLTKELEQCIPDRRQEEQMEGEALGALLNEFLSEIPWESRMIFLRRYWFAESIEEIASRYQISQSKVKTRLHRTRKALRIFLEKEGISL